MSGIAGVYQRQGEPISSEQLNSMVDTLAHRGLDGSKVWHQENVGLGHLMLHTTPESLIEELPYCDRLTDTVITADARIDNRDELIELLDLKDERAENITDSSLILQAYYKWGVDCLDHLLGDFSFAIWDAKQEQLFCARDHFGVKPFYYYVSNSSFIFSSEIKAILESAEVPSQLDLDKVVDHLIGDFDDTVRTFYQHVLRLPPSHYMIVKPNSFGLKCYWSLDISKETCIHSNVDYATEFNKLFTEAVRCRLRSAFPIGSELSGGLNSSAVSCVAKNLLQKADEPTLLHTFSAIFNEIVECDKRDYINEVLKQDGFASHFMLGDRRTPLTDIEDIFWHEDEAFSAAGFAGMTWGLWKQVKDSGVRVLLNGHDGDSTVSHGFGYLHDLARQKRWIDLYIEIRGVAKIYDESAWGGFWNYFSAYTFRRAINRNKYLKSLVRFALTFSLGIPAL